MSPSLAPGIPPPSVAPQLGPTELKAELVARAKALGFDACRVARAEGPRHAGAFRGWLAEGAAGEMQWMQRGEEKRCDPSLVLPGAKSVIVLALNYWQGGDQSGNRRP